MNHYDILIVSPHEADSAAYIVEAKDHNDALVMAAYILNVRQSIAEYNLIVIPRF